MLYLAAVIDWHSKARSKHNIAVERLFRTLEYKNIHVSDYNRLLLKPFSIFGYMSLRSYFNLKYKSNLNITKI